MSKIEVNCMTCRRAKKATLDRVTCKGNPAFNPITNPPCVDWLPTKGIIKRSVAETLEQRNKS